MGGKKCNKFLIALIILIVVLSAVLAIWFYQTSWSSTGIRYMLLSSKDLYRGVFING